MSAPVRRLAVPSDRALGRAAWLWYLVFVGYTTGALFGPAWLVELLGWTTLAGLVALLLTIALRTAYRRGQRAADAWYEPRLAELRAELHALVLAEPAEFIADRLNQAAEQRRRLRELNDRVQSVDFWGRTL
jgi:cobalamin biosynthesis protein CobD/CbiB